jgi:hypothetical protein
MKLPLWPKNRIHNPEGHLGNLGLRTIGQMPDDRKIACPPLHSLRAALSCTNQTGQTLRSTPLDLWIDQVKDRNGEPERGGSEWEPIKILLQELDL